MRRPAVPPAIQISGPEGRMDNYIRAVERAGGEVAVYKTFIHGTPEMAEADVYYVDRLIKMLLWMKGGFKVYLSGSKAVYEAMKATYCVGGKRAFDADFMSNVYEKPFEVVYCDAVPAEKSNPQAVGRHLGGCRIGFGVGLVLALAIEGLDFFDFKARVAVVADELLLGAGKMQGATAGRALIVNALEGHDRSFPCRDYAPMAPPQYSQRPLASGMVVAPQKGQVTAVLGALAATTLSRVS